jgi:hypothetical protein
MTRMVPVDHRPGTTLPAAALCRWCLTGDGGLVFRDGEFFHRGECPPSFGEAK